MLADKVACSGWSASSDHKQHSLDHKTTPAAIQSLGHSLIRDLEHLRLLDATVRRTHSALETLQHHQFLYRFAKLCQCLTIVKYLVLQTGLVYRDLCLLRLRSCLHAEFRAEIYLCFGIDLANGRQPLIAEVPNFHK